MPPLEQQPGIDQRPEARDTMQQVTAEVLESMFFTEAEPAPCEHGWLPGAPCARIGFAGSHRGEMLLGVSAEAAAPIGASFLGLDPMELTEAQFQKIEHCLPRPTQTRTPTDRIKKVTDA